MTVAELEASISVEEFTEWVLLQSIEPWGGRRLDALSAMQQYASLAPWSNGKISLEKLVPNWGANNEQKPETFTDAAAAFMTKVRALANGKRTDSTSDSRFGAG